MILDTNAVSDLFTGNRALERLLTEHPEHQLPVIVIGEYRFGLIRSRYRKQVEPLLETLIRESSILQVDVTTATIYSQVRENLRAKARPIPENDLWIAALTLQHGAPLVSQDDHFDEVDGLRRLSW